MSYQKFLDDKRFQLQPQGFEVHPKSLNPSLFEFQRDIVSMALKMGRFCGWLDCGLGKTIMQLEWAHQVAKHTSESVLILAPLAVAHQTIREGEKFGIEVKYCESQSDVRSGVNITNYEKLEKFDATSFVGVALDESSILKSYDGKFRNLIIESFARTPFKSAWSATPAPNDYMEIGNHAEFVGSMTRTEMLAMFFTHDGGNTSQWRLKGHAESKFWEWVCSWAVMLRKPSDLGYSDDGFTLPPLETHAHPVQTDIAAPEGQLFFTEARSLADQRHVRKESLEARCIQAADLANDSDEQWLIWCDLNDESALLTKLISGAVEVKGSDSDKHKESAMLRFQQGEIRVLVSKPSICGFGMNFQSCSNMAFVGLSNSYEAFYQAVRRCWRFGQTSAVQCHIVHDVLEGAVARNIARKEADAQRMAEQMVKHMQKITMSQVKEVRRIESDYARSIASGSGWTLHLGDCIDVVSELETDSIHYSIFSPPFASLYVYSNSDRDMGNCKDSDEFMQHFEFLVEQLYRVIMPGRLLSFHCMNLPTSKTRNGFIGIKDFRGELIRLFESKGWIFHSEVCIWKDPVTAMQRTKAIGLLHKQLVKDSALSRQGIPDYLVTMRKPGENLAPIEGALKNYIGDDGTAPSMVGSDRDSINIWQRYASPVWMDINPSKTLQYQSARDDKDERHICPLQLQVIERALQLWTNPGDLVLSPFAGIGSEGHVAIGMDRQFVGAELKQSYWQQAVKNLEQAEHDRSGQLPLAI